MKRFVVAALVLAMLLVGTGTFAQSVGVSVEGGFVGGYASLEDSVEGVSVKFVGTMSGYGIIGKVWLTQLPQLTLGVGYSQQEIREKYEVGVGGNSQSLSSTVGTLSSISVLGEYKFYEQLNYSLSITAGVHSNEFKTEFEDGSSDKKNILSVGGKGYYDFAKGLRAVAGASYIFNNLTKEEDEDEAASLKLTAGAEYEFSQLPGFEVGAHFSYQKSLTYEEQPVLYGVNVGARYTLSF